MEDIIGSSAIFHEWYNNWNFNQERNTVWVIWSLRIGRKTQFVIFVKEDYNNYFVKIDFEWWTFSLKQLLYFRHVTVLFDGKLKVLFVQRSNGAACFFIEER